MPICEIGEPTTGETLSVHKLLGGKSENRHSPLESKENRGSLIIIAAKLSEDRLYYSVEQY